MGSISGDELSHTGSLRSSANEERILVSVRIRPLNDKELARNDVSDWECISNNTIVFKNSITERSMYPTAYTFDRVFGWDTSTDQVYEEAAKEVALSVVRGINSTIFAYGQTSSGKTYTMSGVTEHTIADIFNYIEKHKDREYILKFSAIEIYNESVRDLLSQDSTPLRLLDCPERGTVVEKLTEETVKDCGHLKELLSVCEAQRQIGETSLNEVSSRSHQILRLTIESSSIEFLGAQKSSVLAASVNFVDLAGSERASPAMSAGTRLKEGCHINRSLLTLGKVIRKLSNGRNGHIPYRDSKLTRILQNSLGGNARTAIICTMSPARTHVEQSRNTLLFASCAKEVSTNAQVNLVVSDKALVKQLQRELVKLESELKKSSLNLVMPESSVMLKERELLIQKMENEIKELKKERDHALSRVQDFRGSGDEYHEYQVSRPFAEGNQLLKPYVQHGWLGESSASESSDIVDRCTSNVTSGASRLEDFHFLENVDEHFLSDDTSPREEIDKLFGPDPSKGWEMSVQKQHEDSRDQYKDVQCIEETKTYIHINSKSNTSLSKESATEDLSEINTSPKYEALAQKIKKLQKTISYLVTFPSVKHSHCFSDSNMFSPRLTRNRSCRAFFTPAISSQFEKTEENENTPPNAFEIDFLGRLKSSYAVKCSKLKFEDDIENFREKDSLISAEAASVDVKGLENKQQFGDEQIQEAKPIDELTKSTKTKEIFDINNPEITDMNLVHGSLLQHSNWQAEIERQRREIIEFWDVCHVPLSHRTQFFLLFKGDLSDSAYMEVELRRLTFLRSKLFLGTLVIDDQILTLALSKKALDRERRMLSRKIQKKFSTEEREALFQKWDIDLKSKQRRKQLCSRIWTDTKDMKHIKESATLVSKLIGFSESDQIAKEMFGFNIFPGKLNRAKSLSWA